MNIDVYRNTNEVSSCEEIQQLKEEIDQLDKKDSFINTNYNQNDIDPPSEIYKNIGITHISNIDIEIEKGTYNKVFTHPFFSILQIFSEKELEKVKGAKDFEKLLIKKYNDSLKEENESDLIEIIEVIEEYNDLISPTDGKTILVLPNGSCEYKSEIDQFKVVIELISKLKLDKNKYCFVESTTPLSGSLTNENAVIVNQLLSSKNTLVAGGYAGRCVTGTIKSLINVDKEGKNSFDKYHTDDALTGALNDRFIAHDRGNGKIDYEEIAEKIIIGDKKRFKTIQDIINSDAFIYNKNKLNEFNNKTLKEVILNASGNGNPSKK